MSDNVSVYAMFCGVKRSKIWESEVQRANRIYCVIGPERGTSENAMWSKRSGDVEKPFPNLNFGNFLRKTIFTF